MSDSLSHRGEKAGLRARLTADVPVLHDELHDDVFMRSRSSGHPWAPLPPDQSPFAVPTPANPATAEFSIVELATGDLAGVASLWGIDQHNRNANIGITLRPAYRGRGIGTDTVRLLTDYGFTTRGLHRLQIGTLADNRAMIHTALAAGFT
ncbi:GNAT family N-acetyltransferase [Kineosporia succinea]|uniref:RimJ/RimL family protein N-acetyltransferase n=1 Tax=Kineosporia succinea TaxID=84632 RepID=A0ABT9PBA1_9ACTN|nr:GNAT family protein [Kineosporia succinea]MDP9829960.1 RimJ/RimL family protein N-acetyltransferase [Kineosporia succinea]